MRLIEIVEDDRDMLEMSLSHSSSRITPKTSRDKVDSQKTFHHLHNYDSGLEDWAGAPTNLQLHNKLQEKQKKKLIKRMIMKMSNWMTILMIMRIMKKLKAHPNRLVSQGVDKPNSIYIFYSP